MTDPIDVEALLAELGEDECDEDDPWGGANLLGLIDTTIIKEKVEDQ